MNFHETLYAELNCEICENFQYDSNVKSTKTIKRHHYETLSPRKFIPDYKVAVRLRKHKSKRIRCTNV